MSEPKKGIKVVFGPVHPVIEKTEIIKIPSEKAGEKKVVTHLDLQQMKEEFLEIQANTHYIEKGASEKAIKRIAEDGKVLTDSENKKSEKSGMDR